MNVQDLKNKFEELKKRFLEKKYDEVIEECAAFPSGDHDDFVDSTTQALLRFRQGGWIRTTMDEWDDEPKYRRPVEYY